MLVMFDKIQCSTAEDRGAGTFGKHQGAKEDFRAKYLIREKIMCVFFL